MTANSLAMAERPLGWIDHTFLWTASSLTVMAIAATLSGGAHWPAGIPRPAAPPRWTAAWPAARPAPHPFIAFDYPVPGYPIISPFGLRQLPWEEAGRLHKGVDIAAPQGSPVLAAAGGVVLRTGVDGGYGRFMELAHPGGLVTLYGHLSAFLARAGATVAAGQPIGRIGSTGSSTGSHLHFEIHDPRGRAVNPAMFLDRSFLKLADLPLAAAARLPPHVRIAFVSSIPRSKVAQMLAREDAEEAADGAKAPAPIQRPAPVVPTNVRVTFAAAPVLAQSSGLRLIGRDADGRIHAEITPASLTERVRPPP